MMLIPRLFEKPEPESNDMASTDVLYTVGIANDGRTALKLHDGNATMTLFISPEEVERLIKLLAVTIEVSEQDQNNEDS